MVKVGDVFYYLVNFQELRSILQWFVANASEPPQQLLTFCQEIMA
jgi:hypothetical protein